MIYKIEFEGLSGAEVAQHAEELRQMLQRGAGASKPKLGELEHVAGAKGFVPLVEVALTSAPLLTAIAACVAAYFKRKRPATKLVFKGPSGKVELETTQAHTLEDLERMLKVMFEHAGRQGGR